MPRIVLAAIGAVAFAVRAEEALPSIERVVSDLRVPGARETAARTYVGLATLSHLAKISGDESKSREYYDAARATFKAEETAQTRSAPGRTTSHFLYIKCRAAYQDSDEFRREIVDRYFSSASQERYFGRLKNSSRWEAAFDLPAGTRADSKAFATSCSDEAGSSGPVATTKRKTPPRLPSARASLSSPEPAPEPPPEPAEPVAAIEVSAERLYRDYSSNEVAATMKYHNVPLRVKGTIDRVTAERRTDAWGVSTGEEWAQVYLLTSRDFSGVSCDVEKSRAAKLQARSRITCICTGSGYNSNAGRVGLPRGLTEAELRKSMKIRGNAATGVTMEFDRKLCALSE